jgi:glycine cleavage system H protein
MKHPNDRLYAITHEWIQPSDDLLVTVGISDYAQQALGDVIHATLPKVGDSVQAGEACCVLESVKAASDVHAPVTGTITSINEKLIDNPELINDACYTDGWLFCIERKAIDNQHLLSAETYLQQVE